MARTRPLTNFEKQVIKDCYKSTGSLYYDSKVYNWFFKNDFIPSHWEDDYNEYIKQIIISQSTENTDND